MPRKLVLKLTALVAVFGLLLAGTALADNVVNDVNAGGNDTFTLGGSTTVNYWIVATGGDGQSGCNASDGTAATVSVNTPPQVTATPNSLVFTDCGMEVKQAVVFTASAAGEYNITVSVTDTGTGTYNTNPGGFALKVLAPSDTTPPEITPNIVGTLGNNGWYVSDVTVSWTVVDPESEITSMNGCETVTINTDTTGQTLTCTATSAGGTASKSVTIKRDATPPTNVAFSNGPVDGGVYFPTTVPTAPTCTAEDATSGVASCTVTGYSTAVGTHTLTATAIDVAGNVAAATRTYRVRLLTLHGFFQPVDMGAMNTVKGGATVPLKFKVFDEGVEQTATSVVDGFSAKQVACDGSLTEDPVDFTTTGGTSLRYDETAQQFIQNWQTPKQAGKCFSATAKFIDGQSLTATFKLR